MFVYVLDLNRVCRCAERMDAQRSAEFIYSVAAEGFIFTTGCPRRKNGGPFVWSCCPFCGGDLPRDP